MLDLIQDFLLFQIEVQKYLVIFELIQKRQKRVKRVRSKIFGTALRPRLCIFISNRYIYAQLIDDSEGRTLISISGKDKTIKEAKLAGELLAKKAGEKNITRIVFDRRYYKYHGRIKALAEAARSKGLKF